MTQINRQAGLQPVVVDQEVYDLIARTLKLSKRSGGAFDITFAGGHADVPRRVRLRQFPGRY
ncbi:FAD:protein FMN transferase [Hymenobacter qilianensis]|uniref:FAD:protein FMN transferase n=1 Tax=Hymenobacter qilianensis TaxID=1385715 RepID=A0A7H0H0A9_9BACT|nr:FAD:protein FMN transferase [Hymenobacter qilianensis]